MKSLLCFAAEWLRNTPHCVTVFVGDVFEVSSRSVRDSLLPSRPSNYKGWSQRSMAAALKAVIEDGMSVRGAAEYYGVPKSTLGDRVSGRVLPGVTSGRCTYLSHEEEEELVTFLCRTALIGHARTRKEVMAIVDRLLSSRGKKTAVSPGWWASFVARHPKLTLRTPATLSLARANATDRVVIDNYFDELERALDETRLIDRPCQIFNMDETGMPFDPQPLKVVTWRGHKNPTQVSSGQKTQVTVVGCVSAGGQCIPPMVIWDRKNLPPELAVGEVPGTSVRSQLSNGTYYRTLQKYGRMRRCADFLPRVRVRLSGVTHFVVKVSCFDRFFQLSQVANDHFCVPGQIVAAMPRKRRAFGARKRSSSAPASACRLSPKRPKRRKTWDEDSMQAALKAVKEGESISKAARDHGIPKTTLFDRTSGRVAHGTKPGPRPYLNSEEEKELATYLKHCAKVGYGRTRRDVLGLVQTAASDKGVLRSSRISQGWWHRFLERQKDLSLRQGDSTAHVCMDAMNKETIDHYFALLHDTLSTNGLLDKPAQIYNVDESGVPFNPRPPKVVSPKGRQTKKVS